MLRHTLRFAVFALVLLFSSQAFATNGCYTVPQAEAEQGIRIHSELMVISLNCQHMWPKQPKTLYQKYRSFTARNGYVFAEYERTLEEFFKSEGKNAEIEINTLRTMYANKISNDAAKMRPDIFCSHYAQRIDKADLMNDRELRKWAGTFFDEHPVTYPLCTARR